MLRPSWLRAPSAQRHGDWGLFGPDSVVWKVWSYPTSLTVGFQRAVVIEELDPFLVASVHQSGKVQAYPRARYDRTLRYFATVAFADAQSAIQASETLVRIHAKAVGTEPISGLRYEANDPESQLWIHLTAWHSILCAYERYGPGALSPQEERRYWEECATAAELQTFDPADVPRSREGVRAYFDAQRSRLAVSEVTQAMITHLLDAKVVFGELPRAAAPAAWAASKLLRAATIATMPRWMRSLAGLRQPRIVDWMLAPLMRTGFRMVALSTRLEVFALGVLSPSTMPIVAPALLGLMPERLETVTPAQACQRNGTLPARDLYASIRDRAVSIPDRTERARESPPATKGAAARRLAGRAGALCCLITLPALALSLGASAARSAGGETVATIRPAFSPARLGARTAVTFTAHFSGGPEGVPLPVRKAVVQVPAGLGVEFPSTRGCTAAHLLAHGASGCPPNSRIGTGHALVEVRLGAIDESESAVLWAFAGPLQNARPTIEVLGQGYTPLERRVVFTVTLVPDQNPYWAKLVAPIPPIPSIPLEPDAGPVDFSLTIGQAKRPSRPGAIGVFVPKHCPAGGFPWTAQFTYADGSVQEAAAKIPCP